MKQSRNSELERKIKHEAEIAATTQKPRMTESSTVSKQTEGVVDAGDTSLPHWGEEINAAATVKMRSGSLVAEAEAAHHSNECANAAATVFEHADGRLVVEAAATRQSNLIQNKLRANSLLVKKQHATW